MQEIFVDDSDWNKFWENIAEVFKNFPDKKAWALTKAGIRIRAEVQAAIDASGVDDRRYGRVKKWQETFPGSKGGYVAVRPQRGTFVPYVPKGDKKYDGKPKELAFGALTNYLNSGHDTRLPGRRGRYASRKERTKAFRFYQATRDKAEKIAVEEMEAMLKEMGIQISKGSA